MAPAITSEAKGKGQNNFAALMRKFNLTKPSNNDSNDNLPKPIKKPNKNMKTSPNENLIDSNVEQSDPEIPAAHSKSYEEHISEKETASQGDTALMQSVNQDSAMNVKLIKEKSVKNDNLENLTDSNFEQSDLEIFAAHSKPRDEDLMPENEAPSKGYAVENKVFEMGISKETDPTEFTAESVIEKIPIGMALDNLDTMDAKSKQTVSKIVTPEELFTDSEQSKLVSVDMDTDGDISTNEPQEMFIPTAQHEPLQDHINLQDFIMEQPITKQQTDTPKGDNNVNKVEMNMLQKQSPSSAMSLREKHLSSSKSSHSSLYSSGPSSSSLCHLTELSQPKPETLRTTLMCLRRLHGKDAEHLVNIEHHLRGLRKGPKTKSVRKTNSASNITRNKSNKSVRPDTKLSKADDEMALGEGQALDKFAANLFAQFERKRANVNYEVSKLQMPVEIGYYRAVYDALVTTFGQPYHKCTLELYQQLAGELGCVAEMFVMDKTPSITKVNA